MRRRPANGLFQRQGIGTRVMQIVIDASRLGRQLA
jgi:hypothetical protein